MARRGQVAVARVYEPTTYTRGRRVLVDRVWPRGMTKAAAHLDEWCRDVAPSTELRQWYRHDPARVEEFVRRYRAELSEPPAADLLAHLRELAAPGDLTLLTSTREVERSHAAVLADLLREG